MAGGGAVVAMMAAARAQRVQEVTDAFRVADATARERARTLAALGLGQTDEVEELVREGVLLRGHDRDTWYLSEAAMVARRHSGVRRKRQVVAVLAVAIAAMTAVLVGVLALRSGTP